MNEDKARTSGYYLQSCPRIIVRQLLVPYSFITKGQGQSYLAFDWSRFLFGHRKYSHLSVNIAYKRTNYRLKGYVTVTRFLVKINSSYIGPFWRHLWVLPITVPLLCAFLRIDVRTVVKALKRLAPQGVTNHKPTKVSHSCNLLFFLKLLLAGHNYYKSQLPVVDSSLGFVWSTSSNQQTFQIHREDTSILSIYLFCFSFKAS